MHCRLLYLVGQLRAGGLERQLLFLLQSMDRKRFCPALVVWNYGEDNFFLQEFRALEIPIYFSPPKMSGRGKLRWFRRLARKLNPEVIHSYSFYTNFAAWYAGLGSNIIAVGAVQSDFARARENSGFLLGRLCARWPRSQIFNSFAAAESARHFHGFFVPRQISVVRNALDLNRFQSTRLPRESRQSIIGIGSLAPVKRWGRLLRATCRLRDEGLDVLTRIVGDGPLRASLEEQARRLSITDRVEFLGRSNDIPSLLSSATLLAHTSESEGCPNVVMEAMACGRPVVAMDTGDICSLVEDGKTGFVVANGDDEMLAKRIGTLLRDRRLCERMARASRIKAEREFALGRLAEETLAAYGAAGWQGSQFASCKILPHYGEAQ